MDQHGVGPDAAARRGVAGSPAARPERPASGGGIPLGRLLGFPVRLSPTWLILAALVTFSYGQLVGQGRPALPATIAYAIGFGFVLCLVGSVLLHELGHALTSRRYGIGVRGITLEMLGGYTEMERDAPRPSVELAVSLAGPAVSLAVGVVVGLVAVVLPEGTVARQLAIQVALSNLVVAVFNALPGLPLDGGRALQAVIWAVTGDQHRARRIAGWAGRGVAAICLAAALTLLAERWLSVIGAIFILVVAATIWAGAGQALRAGRVAGRIEHLELSNLIRPIVAVAAGTPLAEAQRLAGPTGAGSAVVAVADADGQVLALLNEAAAAAVPADRLAGIAVDAVSRGVDADHVVPAGLRGADLLRAVNADPIGDYLVVGGEDVIGVLRGADLAQLLRPGGRPGPLRSGRRTPPLPSGERPTSTDRRTTR